MKLKYRIFPLLSFSALLVVAIVFSQSWLMLRKNRFEQAKEDIKNILFVTKENISSDIKNNNLDEVAKKLLTLSKTISSRITFIDSKGTVLFDSDANPVEMPKHNDRPEIIQANENEIGESYRYSTTVKKNHLYSAIKVESQNGEKFFLRISQNDEVIFKGLNHYLKSLLISSLIGLMASVIITSLIVRKININLNEIKEQSANFAKLNFTNQIHYSGIHEIDMVAEEINKMASELKNSIEQSNKSNNELSIILSSMKEGVIATDENGRVILANKTAMDIFKINQIKLSEHHFYQELIRNSEIQDMVEKILKTQEDFDREIEMLEENTRFLQARGTPLLDKNKKSKGALIVLNDITKIKKLENMRKDFVANVSHEIRTPLTAILGAVEILRNNNLKEKKQKKILKILKKHSHRLNCLVEDILTLSKIEQGIDKFEFYPCSAEEIILSAIDACKEKAKDKKIKISTEIQDFSFSADRGLFEQAIINLIDNAIKYSDKGKEIIVKAIQNQGHNEISVVDEGCGIPEKDLNRIFERFYRVDKARSRELGGTGLGLAIVKHIVNAHNAEISVKSSPDKGSTFTIKIPIQTV
ncbi:MAG TPA: ATP-binding protein [Victivallales bacterium]|nr:ATP-binding protein [Victivallales bacterium]